MKSGTVQKMAVVGAGQMGRGIAQVGAAAGVSVLLSDVKKSLAQKGKDSIGAILTKQVEKGKMTAEDRDALLSRIEPTESGEGFETCDLAVEAATEHFET